MDNNQEKNNGEPNVHLFGQQIGGQVNDKKPSEEQKAPEAAQEPKANEEPRQEEQRHPHEHHYDHHHDDNCQCHHEKREHWRDGKGGDFVGGLVFLAAGIILLLNTLGVVPWSFWEEIWQFWPALFIIVGVNIFFGQNPILRFIAFLITLGIIVFIVTFGLLQVGSPLTDRLPSEFLDFVKNFGLFKNN